MIGETYVTYLMFLGLFIIMGIGADDIFVLADAWKQSAQQPPAISGSLETRFAWAYARAATSMLATSFTTCAAFAACAISPIWDIKCFGVVNACMVLADYLLVITWMPAVILFDERYLKRARCDRVKQCAGSRVEEFYGGRYARFVVEQRRPIVAVFAVLLLFTGVFWPLTLEADDKADAMFADDHFETVSGDLQREHFERTDAEHMWGAVVVGLRRDDPIRYECPHDLAWAECALADRVGEPLHDAEIDWDNGFGAPRYDARVDLAAPAAQTGFRALVVDFHARLVAAGHATPGGLHCFADECAAWAARRNRTGRGFPVDAAQYPRELALWQNDRARHGGVNASSEGYPQFALAWEECGDACAFGARERQPTRVTVAICDFELVHTVEEGSWPKVSVMEGYHAAAVRAFGEAKRASGAPADVLASAYETASFYYWMIAGRVFKTTAFENMAFGLGLAALVILISTRNWRVALIAAVALYTTISLTFTLIVWAGWKINVLEAIDITVAVGMAVDFTLHLAHTFVHARGDRRARTTKTLAVMGVSVTSGAVTTFAATLVLYLCNLNWFRKFGQFVTMLISMSFVTAMLGLCAALALFGPDEGEGELVLPAALRERLPAGAPKPNGASPADVHIDKEPDDLSAAEPGGGATEDSALQLVSPSAS